MPSNKEARQRWSATATLGTGEGSHTIQAAPGTGKALYVTSLHVFQTVSAAQAWTIQDTSGTVVMLSVPSSGGVGVKCDMDFNEDCPGIKLTDNEALLILGQAAGNKVIATASGYIDGFAPS